MLRCLRKWVTEFLPDSRRTILTPRLPDLLNDSRPVIGAEWRGKQSRPVKQRRLWIGLPRIADLFRIRNRTGRNNNSVALDSTSSPIPFAVIAGDRKLARLSALRGKASFNVIEVQFDGALYPFHRLQRGPRIHNFLAIVLTQGAQSQSVAGFNLVDRMDVIGVARIHRDRKAGMRHVFSSETLRLAH